ncbi:MAG: thymidine phosphorylase [Acidobacteriota bacterium]
MDPVVYRILERKRHGEELTLDEVRTVVDGAADGSWGDAELGAFLMAASIRGLDDAETHELAQAMLESGEQWDLAADLPTLGDKHSTGGVGDGVSLLLAPLMAALDRPVMMLAGRGLGHTGGTIDKLEAIPGVELSMDRARCFRTLEAHGMAIGQATGSIAPADRRLYALRDRTATIDVLPLICGSIVSKKLAVGPSAIVFDVKAGSGAFMQTDKRAHELARLLVQTCRALGRDARALVTDMNQPLGRWVGHTAELQELYECFAGDGSPDFLEVTFRLCEELCDLVGRPVSRDEMETAIASGRVRERFEAWAAAQGADAAWLRAPRFELAPVEVLIEAPRDGVLAAVATRELGMLLAEAAVGRAAAEGAADHSVALRVERKLGEAVRAQDPLVRLYLRRDDAALIDRFRAAFKVAETGDAPQLVRDRVV